MSNAHVWRAAQERLRQQMTRAQYETWLRGTWLDGSTDGATVLCVRTTFVKELLETRFRERIEAAISDVTGQVCRLRVTVAASESAGAREAAPVITSAQPRGITPRLITHRGAHINVPAHDTPMLFTDTEDTSHAARPITSSEERPHVADVPNDTRVAPITSSRRRLAIAGGNGASGRSERMRAALARVRGQEPGETPAPHEPVDGAQRDQRDQRDSGRAERAAPRGRDVAAGAKERDDETIHERRSGSLPRRHSIDGSIRMSEHESADEERGSDQLSDGQSQDNVRSLLPSERHDAAPAGGSAFIPGQLPPPRLNSRYTFSTFIVGSNNQLAHAASQAVAEAPGQAYNPLFLYGSVGLGKTHLLHAIGHTAIACGLVVLYVSSETFTNEIINAIRYRTTEDFRAKYRSVDVLLVDDIQFIAGKESTEEEFFHTFNTLHENSKQIVICSDRPPKAIVSLAERLRSRFEWGLIADIQPPDLETRVAILRAKSDVLGRRVPDDVVAYLASRVQSNIRELEGSFNRLLAIAQLQGMPLTIDTAKAALASLATDGRQRRVNIAEVLEAVAEYYRIAPEDLCGKQRDKHIVVPRQIAMYLMRQETEASLLEIGQALGGRDHSTVLHGCEKIGREVNDNTAMRKEVLAIRQQLLG